MELVEYARVLRRRALLIALAMVLGAAGAFGASLLQTKTYRSVATYIVSAASVDEVSSRQLSVVRAGTYAQIGTTGPAVDAALDRLGLLRTAHAPVDVDVLAQPNSSFLSVTVSSTDPGLAQQLAETYGSTLPGVVARLTGTGGSAEPLRALAPAVRPTKPFSPRPLRNALVGLALGLVLGTGVAFLREALDRTFKDPDALEDSTNTTVLGTVPLELEKVELPIISHPGSTRAEAYRQVRTNIQFAGPEHTLKKLVITSATPGEGKTTVAVNLAVAFGRTGQRVVLVDADMRRPRVASAFGLAPDKPGLSELLTRDLDAEDLFLRIEGEDNVRILGAGALPGNPSELLGSARMTEVLQQLGEQFDVVLIDTPPVLPVTDPLVLAVNATGVVLVVRLGETSRERLRRSLAAIQKLRVPLLGMVANGAVASSDAAYAYKYGYGYAAYGRRGTKDAPVSLPPLEVPAPAGAVAVLDARPEPTRVVEPVPEPASGMPPVSGAALPAESSQPAERPGAEA